MQGKANMTKPISTHATWLHVRAARPVVVALQALGVDADALLKRCNIARALLDEADGKIAHQAMMNLWQEALFLTGDTHLGLHLAEAVPLEAFGLHTYALLSSPTLREAYRRACRYQRLIHTGTRLLLQEEAAVGSLEHMLPGGMPAPRQPAEFLVTLWVRLGRLLVGDDFAPLVVFFAHDAPEETHEHERIFQTTVYFRSGRTAIQVANQLLDRGNDKADPGLARILDEYAHHLLASAPASATLSDYVRSYLVDALIDGAPTADSIAASLPISVRTLHRNLHEEGTSLRALLSQVRHEQATRHLANPQISIAEVAFLLGFAELSSFYRAFHGWTGMTPATYRAAVLTAVAR